MAINIYDISQQAKQIYSKAKDTDKKRQLLRLVFEKITMDDERIYFAYSKAFKLLSEAVRATNSTKIKNLVIARMKNFEPKEKTDVIGQMDGFYAYRPILLPIPSYNINIEEIILQFTLFQQAYHSLPFSS